MAQKAGRKGNGGERTNRGGRPTKATPEAIKTILRAKKLGMRNRECAELAGITPRTLQRWIKADPVLSLKLATCRAEAVQFGHSCLFVQAKAGSTAATRLLLRSLLPEVFGEKVSIDLANTDEIARSIRESLAGVGDTVPTAKDEFDDSGKESFNDTEEITERGDLDEWIGVQEDEA